MKDGGEKELGMGEERREEEKREDKILLSCRQTESPGVRWEWGRREGGVFLKQGSKLLRRSCVRVRVSLVCVCVSALHFSILRFATGDRVVTLASVISCSSNPSRNPIFLTRLSPPSASCTIFVSTARDVA